RLPTPQRGESGQRQEWSSWEVRRIALFQFIQQRVEVFITVPGYIAIGMGFALFLDQIDLNRAGIIAKTGAQVGGQRCHFTIAELVAEGRHVSIVDIIANGEFTVYPVQQDLDE